MDLNSSSEEETGFDCLQENSDTEENMAPTRCDENAHKTDTEPLLSADLRRRLKDRLRKRFNEEDLDYFHDDSSGGIHAHGHDSPNTVHEDWGDSQGSNEAELPGKDFAERPHEQNSLVPLSDKCGVLICFFFVLVFLAFWIFYYRLLNFLVVSSG